MELKTYLSILARRWRIASVATIVIACLITLLGFSMPPKYQAETLLRVITPLGGRTGETNYQTTFAVRLMNTYAQIATSDEVMNALKDQLGVETLPDITVNMIPDSEIIQIVVEGSSASQAAIAANLLAQILIDNQIEAAENSIDSEELNILLARQDELAATISQSQNELDDLVENYSRTASEIIVLERTLTNKELSLQSLQDQYEQAAIAEAVYGYTSNTAMKEAISVEIEKLEPELDALYQQYLEVSAQANEYSQQITATRQTIQNYQSAYTDTTILYDSVLAANSRQANAQNLAIVSPAVEPSKSISISRTLIGGLGLLCGLIAGIITAFLVDNLDTRIYSIEQIQQMNTSPVLGKIPRFHDRQHALVPVDKLEYQMARENWMLCTKILSLIQEKNVRAILVTSPNPKEGKSKITFDLASGLARKDLKVLIVDANLVNPMQQKLFGVSGEHGLCEFLSGNLKNVKEMIIKNVAPGIDLIPSLDDCANMTDLFQASQLNLLFETTKTYDAVLFDSPAILSFPDTYNLATKVDGVILVSQWGRTKINDIKITSTDMDTIDAELLGIVLNQIPPSVR